MITTVMRVMKEKFKAFPVCLPDGWCVVYGSRDQKKGGYDDPCKISAISNHFVWYYPISTAEETEAHNILRSVHTEQGLRIQVFQASFCLLFTTYEAALGGPGRHCRWFFLYPLFIFGAVLWCHLTKKFWFAIWKVA